MTAALVSIGDRYRAPDGVLYTLTEESALEPLGYSSITPILAVGVAVLAVISAVLVVAAAPIR